MRSIFIFLLSFFLLVPICHADDPCLPIVSITPDPASDWREVLFLYDQPTYLDFKLPSGVNHIVDFQLEISVSKSAYGTLLICPYSNTNDDFRIEQSGSYTIFFADFDHFATNISSFVYSWGQDDFIRFKLDVIGNLDGSYAQISAATLKVTHRICTPAPTPAPTPLPRPAPTPTPPPDSTEVQATANLNSISVLWNASQRATSYDLYWSSSSEVSNTHYEGKINTGSLSYIHTNLKYLTIYYYAVYARNSSGISERSNVAGATTYFAAEDEPRALYLDYIYDHIRGDYNGDGLDDILFQSKTTRFDSHIGISDGSGGFNPLINIVNADPYYRVFWSDAYDHITGDFNGDGLTDVLMQNKAGNIDSLLTLAAPAGGFNDPINIVEGNNYLRVFWSDAYNHITGDFNGDGLTDVLMQNKAGTIDSLLTLAAPTGGFNDPIEIPNTYNFWSDEHYDHITGDFNGDGLTDVLMQNKAGDTDSFLTLAAPAGGFNEPINIANGNDFWRVFWSDAYDHITGDFNGDGLTDVLMQNKAGNIDSLLTLAAPAGGFNEPINIVNGNNFWRVFWSNAYDHITGDFNGDGLTDVLMQNKAGNIDSLLTLAAPAGGFNDPINIVNSNNYLRVFWSEAYAHIPGDYNGDGLTDILMQNKDGNIDSLLGLSTGNGFGDSLINLIR